MVNKTFLTSQAPSVSAIPKIKCPFCEQAVPGGASLLVAPGGGRLCVAVVDSPDLTNDAL